MDERSLITEELVNRVLAECHENAGNKHSGFFAEAAHEGEDGDGLFSKNDGKGKASGAAEIDGIALTRLPLITEAEYQKNPLAADVKFWGHWVLEKARDEIGQFYPQGADGIVSGGPNLPVDRPIICNVPSISIAAGAPVRLGDALCTPQRGRHRPLQ